MPADDQSQESETITLTVSEQDAGKRLDAYLASQISNWSRARLQRLIEDAEVLVNGESAKASYKLHNQDQVEIDLASLPTSQFIPENIPLEVVYEDDTLIVINKPAGLIVHPGAGIASGTLANALAYHFSKLSTQAGSFRPGIVHRINKGTSGLLVVAKTEQAHEHLAEQFRQRTVYKSYVALVHGNLETQSGRIEQPIARDQRNRVRMAVNRSGRAALSLYRVRQRYQRFTLLDIELKTGRTHQIRVHLAWLKHPVVGDDLYGGGRDNSIQDSQLRNQVRKLGRQFLHSEKLGFIHPRTQASMSFSAPLPDELTRILAIIE